ncbi:MAG: PadR family transcriptional regulator [Chloroflexales bacterium]|nr:PadR family transcriptional regulator [Chloroflexales bacterium]
MPMVKQPLTIEHALLGFVRQQPMYGYEIHQRLLASAELGLVWNLKQSLLYALLARLEDEGYLTSTLEPQGARPPRKILHLTKAGAAAFVAWVNSPVEHARDFRVEFLAKLYFAHSESRQVAQELIERQQQVSGQRLVGLRRRAAALEAASSFDWLVLRYRIGQLEAMMAWLDLCTVWLTHPERAHDVSGMPSSLLPPDTNQW